MKPLNSILILLLDLTFVSIIGVWGLTTCPKNQLPCDNKLECIDRNEWCDEETNCNDKSDEKYCKKKRGYFNKDPNGCGKTHFLCGNGLCFPKDAKCDGYKDCISGNDEENCDATTVQSTVMPSTVKRDKMLNTEEDKENDSDVFGSKGNSDDDSSNNNDDDNNDNNDDVDDSSSGDEDDSSSSEDDDDTKNEEDTNIIKNYSTNNKRRKTETVSNKKSKHSRAINEGAISNGLKWLLSTRDNNHGWDTSTSRALITFGLVNPEKFSNVDDDARLMQKQLQVLIAMDLFRNGSKPITLNRLALYINAMLATCQNPENFHGVNLVQELRIRTTVLQKSQYTSRNFISPVVYLSLCLGNQIEHHDLYKLIEILRMRAVVAVHQDMKAFSILALSCIETLSKYKSLYANEMKKAIDSLLPRMTTGDIGNVYSTAIAAQALSSTSMKNNWKSRVIQFLEEQQLKNGSFGDIMATYYILPILAGKSFLDLKFMACAKPTKIGGLITIERLKHSREDKINVRYSLYIDHPKKLEHTIDLLVPKNTSFFDIMKLSEYDDSKFKFLFDKDNDNNVNIYSIGNIPNDAERGYYWQLFIRQPEAGYRRTTNHDHIFVKQTNPVNKLYPKNHEHIIFWYREF